MLSWFLWNLWLLFCFIDHISPFWPASSWESEEYRYGSDLTLDGHQESRKGECLITTTPRECRRCHLQVCSYFCCSRRSPLECTECRNLKLSAERKKKFKRMDAWDEYVAAATAVMAFTKKKQPAATPAEKSSAKTAKEDAKAKYDLANVEYAEALKASQRISEGTRIGSGRILCNKHLQDYYIHKPERTRTIWLWRLHDWLCVCISCFSCLCSKQGSSGSSSRASSSSATSTASTSTSKGTGSPGSGASSSSGSKSPIAFPSSRSTSSRSLVSAGL